jgi:dissimilatory sulfite reductase (desulfoviridin) alpha/beta subunit
MTSFKNTWVEGIHYDVIPQSDISKINKKISEDSTLNVNYKPARMYSEEEVKEIIKLSCEEGMLIQRTINDKVKIPYWRIKDFTIRMFEQFKNK